jgi:thiol-disulfide isomerase/thioredoxin
MRRALCPALVFALWLAAVPASAAKPFPDLRLPAPKASEAKALGLPSAAAFRLSELNAEVAILVLGGYFCAPCREEAPRLAELSRIVADRGLSRRVVLLGIMAGDSAELTARFRKDFAVPYPLFPDPFYELHRALGSPAVPQIYALRLGRKLELVLAKSGGFRETPAKFLDLVLAKAGLR